MIDLSENQSSRRKRVTFVTFQLGGGGAEMQLLRLANTLDRKTFEVSVIVFRSGGSYEPLLRDDVTLVSLNNPSKVSLIHKMAQALRRLDADLVCAFLDIPMATVFLARPLLSRRPVLVGCVQAPPTIVYGSDQPRKLQMFLRFYGRILPKIDHVIAISEGVKDDIRSFAPSALPQTEVIYNIGVDDRLRKAAEEPVTEVMPSRPLIVACGRLNYQKAFDVLIRSFALVRKEIDAELWIIGEGEKRGELEALIDKLNLSASVRLIGFRQNPYQIFASADLFVLSSIFEGFGNVLVEAMACGTPVLSTICPHGPSEIITDQESGILVPVGDVPAIAEGIIKILTDRKLSARLAAAGKQRAEDFSPAVITAQYSQTFEQLIEGDAR
ncbi:glycosyltransferase [Altererythrobacter aurantiacus]|uniref:Glycosyltransferase n=1 Tax=Parapontixanthobacter aurantiacus TaxID=1463599 RepID=A0A844ZMA6_9SPHN|nr:glycosyltransferase [Parapontixanthobacter aurantiacus]MXO86789.1 glycosyltransferase [Parapontixanthobacter aurantiacus]